MFVALILSFIMNIVLILINPNTLDSIERLLERSVDRSRR